MRAFVIRPFGTKTDKDGREINFESVHDQLIGPALMRAGYAGDTTTEIVEAGNIRSDMFQLIIQADLAICDITTSNANVLYELGIRHSLCKKSTLLIKGEQAAGRPPFNLGADRYFAYDIDDPANSLDDLIRAIHSTRYDSRETDSPIFRLVPDLKPIDRNELGLFLPSELREDIERAEASQLSSWLRVLASDVSGAPYQWPAYRLIAAAQARSRDIAGAKHTWLKVREHDPQDIPANLALGNLYEREYRGGGPSALSESDLALKRVLENDLATKAQRAEALGQQARNSKSRWRREFESIQSRAERRAKAASGMLLETYRSYLEAYKLDLNAFWPGLAALQMGTIAVELASENAWGRLFHDPLEAQYHMRKLQEEMTALRGAIQLSVSKDNIEDRLSGDDLMWAKISRCDLLVLNSDDADHVYGGYCDAIPATHYSAHESVIGQLSLFSALGVRAKIVDAILPRLRQRQPAAPAHQDIRVVLFAGHRVDEADRREPRFPAASEGKARELIRAQVETLQQTGVDIVAYASAAPGGDIIFHEVCRELDVKSRICLPMPVQDFTSIAFSAVHPAWCNRFINLVDHHTQTGLSPMVSSATFGVSRWLQKANLDPWERGNRWVLEIARTSKANSRHLIALWDGKDQGDAPGGTAHMLRIAKGAHLQIHLLDAAELVGGG